jgi:hypothetical protein
MNRDTRQIQWRGVGGCKVGLQNPVGPVSGLLDKPRAPEGWLFGLAMCIHAEALPFSP